MSNFHEGLATAILIEILLKKCNNKSVTPCLVVRFLRGGRVEWRVRRVVGLLWFRFVMSFSSFAMTEERVTFSHVALF